MFWLVTVLGLSISVIVGFISQTNRYRRFQAITKDTIRFEDEFEFPAVTICSYCTIQNNTWTEEWEKQVLDVVMQSTESYIRKDVGNLTIGNISLSAFKFAELSRKMGVTAEKLFHTCYWQGAALDCTEVMKPKSVIHSNCYTFNYKEQRDRFVVTAIGTFSALSLALFLNRDECFFGDIYGSAGIEVIYCHASMYAKFLWKSRTV